jgi:hypothetical protein
MSSTPIKTAARTARVRCGDAQRDSRAETGTAKRYTRQTEKIQ